MSFLKLKNGLLIGLVMVSLVFISAKTYSTDESSKEVLLVEIYMLSSYVMHISQNDQPLEIISLHSMLTRKGVEKNGPLIQSKFQELYNKGWELQSTTGGDQVQRYIMVR